MLGIYTALNVEGLEKQQESYLEDIKKKKALQAKSRRMKLTKARKAEVEMEKNEAQRKAANLPTLDEHFRVHGVEAYTLDLTIRKPYDKEWEPETPNPGEFP